MLVYATSLVVFDLSYVSSSVRSSAEYQGIFDSFLKKFLFLLSGGTNKQVKKICKTFEKHLKPMEYRQYTKKLAKKFKELSHMDQSERMSELTEYTDALENKSHKVIEFFKAINAAFTLQQQVQFEDYLYNMEDFIRRDKLLIEEETETLLNDVILKSIRSLSKRDQDDLEKKLKRVLKEHKKASDVNYELSLLSHS